MERLFIKRIQLKSTYYWIFKIEVATFKNGAKDSIDAPSAPTLDVYESEKPSGSILSPHFVSSFQQLIHPPGCVIIQNRPF